MLFLFPLTLLAADPGTEFAVAIGRGDVKAVSALLAAGRPADTLIGEGDGQSTPLQQAAWQGRTAIAKLLIEHGADVNAAGGPYGTPLLAAVSSDWDDLAEVLLNAGAKIDERDRQGNRALGMAASAGKRDMAALLIKFGAKLEESGPGYSPLMNAAMSGDPEMIRLLVRAGARIDAPARGADYGGMNPLLAAAQGGAAESLRTLIELKANVNARTSEGETALDLARAAGHEEIVTILKAAGAREGKAARRKP